MKKIILILLGFYSSAIVSQNNLVVCQDDGFEGLVVGSLASAAWTASYAPGQNNTGAMVYNVSYTAGSNYAQIVSTPYNDFYLGVIPASPFAGSNVALLNYGNYTERTRIGKTINVTPSNFIYRYAYRAVGGGSLMGGQSAFRFNFYDCSGNLLTNLSKTVQPTTSYTNLVNNPDVAYWTDSSGTTGVRTPEWIVTDVNLSAYVGTCVQVQSDVNPCTCGGYMAYYYYDDMCSDKFVFANPALPKDAIPRNTLVTAANYTSCVNTATLGGLSGFSSYSWQGPVGSGVSGSTLTVITTTMSGNYTLTASTGTNSFTQEVNLIVGNSIPTIVASNTYVCPGTSVTLQSINSGVNNYNWSTGQSTSSIAVSPSVTTIYTLTTTDNFNCSFTSTASVTFKFPNSILVSSPQEICEGGQAQLAIINQNLTGYSYLWNTGATTSSISVSPLAGTYIYTLTASQNFGCSSVITETLVVNPFPQVQITSSVSSICVGQFVNLNAQGNYISAYSWNNISFGPTLAVNPNQTSVYTVTVGTIHGCTTTASKTITVYALPQAQIIQPAAVCSGQPFQLTVQGDNNIVTYLWSNGENTLIMSDVITANANYILTVTNSNGCVSTASLPIVVNPLPALQVSVDASTICEGSSANLSAIGSSGLSYVWDNGATGQTLQVSPVATSTYVVAATDGNGCISSVSTVINVSRCTGIEQVIMNASSGLIVFPNPATSSFTIKGYKQESGQILNSLGQLIREFKLTNENNFSADISGLSQGVYFVKGTASAISVVIH